MGVMKNEKWISLPNIVAALCIATLVISASVTVALFDKDAYDRVQKKMGLPEAIGLSEEETLENYSALIDYNSVFFTGRLEFPTLSMSESGEIHFAEVKEIFSFFQIALIVSAVLTLFLTFLLLRKRRYRFLALGGILSLAIPAAAVCGIAIAGWDRFFVLFHELVFSNDFWVFDYRADPVILILPDAFFLDCLVRIVVGVAVSAMVLIVSSAALRRRRFH